MKNLVLHADSVLAYWLGGPESEGAAMAAIFDCADRGGCRLWMNAGSLPALADSALGMLDHDNSDAEVNRATVDRWLRELKPRIEVLSDFGFEQMALVGACTDLKQAQLARSAMVIQGEKRIVSGLPKFDSMGVAEVLPAKEALRWVLRPSEEVLVDFVDLKNQQDTIRPVLEANIQGALRHGRYILGPEVAELETRLTEFVGCEHCIGVSSGTDALLIAMMALGIGPGDEVITTAFTFIATGEMIVLLGARPVFVDIDAKTYNIDPALIEAAITEKTRAIIPVSLYGQCADMDAINAIAARHGLPVIEDAAQSLGATYKGRSSCALSTIGCTSFFPSKPLGAYGDAGACFTHDEGLAKVMREIRVHGQDRRYHHARIGINGRIDTLQAAVLLAKLDHFGDEIEERARVGNTYCEMLLARGAGWTGQSDAAVLAPYVEAHNTSVFAQFTVQVADRDRLRDDLNSAGIPMAVHYPVPLNQQPAMDRADVSRPIAEQAAQRVLSLPMHAGLRDRDLERVVQAVLPDS